MANSNNFGQFHNSTAATYANLVALKIYAGSFDEFIVLSAQEKAQLITQLESIKEKYKKDLKRGIFNGTIVEYASLNEIEQLELRVKRFVWKKGAVLDLAERLVRELKTADLNQFESLSESYYSDLMPSFYNYVSQIPSDLFSEVSHWGIPVPEDLTSLVSTEIERPKFGFMEKKYKVLDSLITDQYIFKLKTRQIDSDFSTDEDYNSKQKWKAYLDRKADEYRQLINDGLYDGSFESYLNEDIITTTGLLRFNKRKKFPSFDTTESLWFTYQADKVQTDAHRKMIEIMRGPAAQDLMYHTVSAMRNIMGDEALRDLEQRYRNGEFDDPPEQPRRM